ISFYNIKLKLSLIKSFFSANSTKPIFLAIILLNNNKIFSYFKKIIVTSAVYLRLVKFFYFNI
ncbi:hypothetical protein BP00DRAFT_339149, partial [Aspergillus indologenus CBS 114.80]